MKVLLQPLLLPLCSYLYHIRDCSLSTFRYSTVMVSDLMLYHITQSRRLKTLVYRDFPVTSFGTILN